MKILAVRLTALGDVANTCHAISGLKRALPSARVAWLVEEAAADLVRADDDVDETLVLPRRRWQASLRRPLDLPRLPLEIRRFARGLRERRFDVLLDFQGHLKSGIIGLLSRVPRRIGFSAAHCRERNHWFTTERVDLPARPLPRAEKALALVRRLAPAADAVRPHIRPSAASARRVASWLARTRRGAARLVGMHPGTSGFGRFKRWPVERFAAVARMLRDQCGARTIVTWGAGEEGLAHRLVALADGAAALAPATSLADLIEILRPLDLFIAGDTGPLHVAALLGRPVVAVFGPKDPVTYGPYRCRSRIVRKALACSPCTQRRCDHLSCLLDIQPGEVFEAAADLLG